MIVADAPPAVKGDPMRSVAAVLLLALPAAAADPPAPPPPDRLAAELTAYRAALAGLRAEWTTAYRLPAVDFFLFGMADRRKLLFRDGRLLDARTGAAVRRWEGVADVTVCPPLYAVTFTAGGRRVTVWEDEAAVWVSEAGRTEAVARGTAPVALPAFAGHRHAPVLRVLHQEMLVNVADGRPVPNLMVYRKPWHRDAAMVGMALARTGNAGLIRDWVLGLRDPYDRNNAGQAEPDNLGQALYLLSLAGADAGHPLAKAVLAELPKVTTPEKAVAGKTDFAPHPVYQTKWLKVGLAALKLPDDYRVPRAADSYSSLVWWAYRDEHVPGKPHAAPDYPYLGWADDHFYGTRVGPVGDRDYPLTWEANASQADYRGTAALGPGYAGRKLAAPHTWHAAEMFLLLHDRK
jgi:hypothetical protein